MVQRGRGNLTFHGPFLGSSAQWKGVSETFQVALGRDPKHLFFLAGIAQLVEHHLAKVGVAGSSPVSRSVASDHGDGSGEGLPAPRKGEEEQGGVVERVDSRSLFVAGAVAKW